MNAQRVDSRPVKHTGPLAWMIHNRITPNLIMVILLVGGLFMGYRIKQEIYPDFELDYVNIRVPYPGASPEEVEQGIILAVEETVRGIDGIKEVSATASEGGASVSVEILEDADAQRVYQDIQQGLEGISTFPVDAEKPRVSIAARWRWVLSLLVYGDADEWVLRDAAERIRDRLLQSPDITQVDLSGVRDYEIRIDVPQENLRAYGLTLSQIAQTIRQSAIELPGGSIKSQAGEILLRVKDRRDWAREFGAIPIVTTAEGAVLYLRDIAVVSDSFEDSDRIATYEGHSAVGVEVYRVGTQTPISVSTAARAAIEEIRSELPPGIGVAVRSDQAKVYQQRVDLLLKNAYYGLVLVLLALGAFLQLRLAFWVTMAIPTALLGTILFMPAIDVSINMISMFAFIMTLGLVVDSAIVAGENIFEYRSRGMNRIDASIQGVRDVSLAISFSILTNIAAFVPLMYLPGTMGKVWAVVPAVVIIASLISWFAPLFVLPSQLAHSGTSTGGGFMSRVEHLQGKVSQQLTGFVKGVYSPFLDACIRRRYLTVSICLAVLVVMVAYAASGRMGIVLMAKVESDRAYVTATLPYGSPVSRSIEVRDRLVAVANEVRKEHGGDRLVEGVYARIDGSTVDVALYLTDPDIRPISTAEVTNIWRDKVGMIPGLESLTFESDRGGPGRGASITVELTHRDIGVLSRACSDLAGRLEQFARTRDVDDGYNPGKVQINFRLKAEGQSLGLTSSEVARQVRNAFWGAEALRQQRGRSEVTARVRLPESERVSEYDIEQLLIRTPAGRDVPLYQIAEVSRGRAYTSITRRDGRRNVRVSGNVVPDTETNKILATLRQDILPQLTSDYPGLTWSFRGRQADMAESMDRLYYGFVLALIVIFILLAIPFRSYIQPIIVMMAIPFGIVGALLGHLIMGYAIDLVSMMGIVALAGVVVNNALVMIDYANRRRADGDTPSEAIHGAGTRRFRPIILTTLTTFGGLAPMIFETSRQARFMIPMAISLGYGILFATAVTLILVPCLYLMIEDITAFLRGGRPDEPVPAVAAKPAHVSSVPDMALDPRS